MKQIAQKLEAEMAKAVSIIMTASHAAAIEALNEAFGIEQQRLRQKAEPRQRQCPTSRNSSAPRRSAAEIQALEERFLQAAWDNPGEAMTVLSSRVEANPAELQVPVARLKASGRLKTVGERQFTRYFPIERNENGGDRTNS